VTTHCENCGAAASDDYARVFGDNKGRLHRCPDCPDTASTEMGFGTGAGLDPDRRKASRGGGL